MASLGFTLIHTFLTQSTHLERSAEWTNCPKCIISGILSHSALQIFDCVNRDGGVNADSPSLLVCCYLVLFCEPARESPAVPHLSSLCSWQQSHLVNGGRPYSSQMSNAKPIGAHAIPKMRWHNVGAAWVLATFFADAMMPPPPRFRPGQWPMSPISKPAMLGK